MSDATTRAVLTFDTRPTGHLTSYARASIAGAALQDVLRRYGLEGSLTLVERPVTKGLDHFIAAIGKPLSEEQVESDRIATERAEALDRRRAEADRRARRNRG